MMRVTSDLNVCVRVPYAYAGLGGTPLVGVAERTDQWSQVTGYTYAGYEYSIEPKARIAIDPNVRVRGNGTYSGFEDVTGPIAVGDEVEVYEAESNLVGLGHVTEIDGARELVYLSVDWSSLTDESAPPRQGPEPASQAIFVSSELASTSGGENAWMTLAARPSLARLVMTEAGLSFVAPAFGWSGGYRNSWSVSSAGSTFDFAGNNLVTVTA